MLAGDILGGVDIAADGMLRLRTEIAILMVAMPKDRDFRSAAAHTSQTRKRIADVCITSRIADARQASINILLVIDETRDLANIWSDHIRTKLAIVA